jgi:hypothetical protein
MLSQYAAMTGQNRTRPTASVICFWPVRNPNGGGAPAASVREVCFVCQTGAALIVQVARTGSCA